LLYIEMIFHIFTMYSLELFLLSCLLNIKLSTPRSKVYRCFRGFWLIANFLILIYKIYHDGQFLFFMKWWQFVLCPRLSLCFIFIVLACYIFIVLACFIFIVLACFIFIVLACFIFIVLACFIFIVLACYIFIVLACFIFIVLACFIFIVLAKI
jgi:hypothetical protein